MGNNAGKEGYAARGAVGNKKTSLGGMFRQGSMSGEQGKKGAQQSSNTSSSWGTSMKRVEGVGTQIVISEKSREGSWPPFAVSSVQGMRKGMEDEFYAGGEVGFHPFLPMPRFDFPPGSPSSVLRPSPCPRHFARTIQMAHLCTKFDRPQRRWPVKGSQLAFPATLPVWPLHTARPSRRRSKEQLESY